MPQSDYFNGPLYQRLSDDLHLAGVAKRTHDGYLRAVRQLADHAQCSPDVVTEEQLRQWLLHLKVDRQFAYGSLRVAFSGVKFFFTRTCRRDWKTLSETKLRNVKSLPEVLTVKQVHQIIDTCKTLPMRTFFWTVYSLGLRLEEGLSLRVGDIDSQRMMVHVHRGKGAKDRYLPLPSSTLKMLRENWKSHQHPKLLFPNNKQTDDNVSSAKTPMGTTTVQGAIKKITRKLNFGKNVSTHTLRHCYATHLLEAGLSLRAIQKLLGHSALQTTTVYLHLTDDAVADARKVIEETFVRKACNEETFGRRT